MGGEGHSLDMINRIKQNQSLLQDRRKRLRYIREAYQAHYTMQTKKSQEPPNLKSVKEEIRKELIQKRRKALILSGCLIFIVLILIVLLCLYIPFENLIKTFFQ